MSKPWKSFNVPIYGGSVFVYKDRKDFDKAVAKYNANYEKDDKCVGGRCVALYNNKGVSHYVVGWFYDYKPTLIHEIGHLALFILERAGINPADSNGEVYCYLLAHLYKEIME